MRNNVATINSIPFLLIGKEKVSFKWKDEDEGIGTINGRRVQVKPFPVWGIFLIKTLPIMLILFLVTNNFFVIREFINLAEGKVLGIMAGVSIFVGLYSIFFLKSNIKLPITFLAVLFYSFISFKCLNAPDSTYVYALEYGVGATLEIFLILFSFWDILTMLSGDKKMYYILDTYKKFFKFDGIFLSLYTSQNYNENHHEVVS